MRERLTNALPMPALLSVCPCERTRRVGNISLDALHVGLNLPKTKFSSHFLCSVLGKHWVLGYCVLCPCGGAYLSLELAVFGAPCRPRPRLDASMLRVP